MSEDADEGRTKSDEDAPASEPRPRTLKHGLDPSEMGRRSAAARRARAAERAAADAEAATTFRQRLGISLSRLSQEELDAAIRRMAADDRPSALTALARMADQAFGKPAPEEEEDKGAEDDVRSLTRAQRSALIASLLAQEEPVGDASDPRGGDADPLPPAPPHPRD